MAFSTMPCPEAVRLFERYQEALTRFHAARLRLSDAGDYASRYAEAGRARTEYWQHIQAHGCRMEADGTEKCDVESQLRAEMQEAHQHYKRAAEEYRNLMELSADVGYTSDGAVAQQQARRLHAQASTAYRFAVRRYADYVLQKKEPEHLA